MLNRTHPRATSQGLSLIEIMVALTVLSVSLAIGAPAFGTWLQNIRIRASADAIQNDLYFARLEALRRNTPVRLQLTSTLDNHCILSATGTSWVVSLGADASPEGACAAPFADGAGTGPIRTGSFGSATGALRSTASQTVVAFDGLGRQASTTNPTQVPAALTIQLTSSTGACIKDGGPIRCLNVTVTPAGQVRMCDASAAGASDAMAC